MEQIPVYVFTGFLDSGKTKFIQETLEDGQIRYTYCNGTVTYIYEFTPL